MNLFKSIRKRKRKAKSADADRPARGFPLELKDVLVFGGLGMSGWGLWQIYPPSAMILIGGILFALGLFWYMGQGK